MGDFAGTDELPIIICFFFFFLLPSTDKMVSSDQLSFRHNILLVYYFRFWNSLYDRYLMC
jgi:hypothetical protein